MADTPQTWTAFLMAFLMQLVPTFGQAIILILTALLSIGGTVATQRLVSAPTAPMVIPAADKPTPAVLSAQITAAVDKINGRLDVIEGSGGLCVEEIQRLQKDLRPAPAVRRLPAKAAVK